MDLRKEGTPYPQEEDFAVSKIHEDPLKETDTLSSRCYSKELRRKRSFYFPFMSNDSQSSFLNEGLNAPDDGLGIEVAIEPFIEASLEVEEEQHHFTGL